MKSFGIGCVFHYTPLNQSEFYSGFANLKSQCPNTEFISDRIVRLPIWIGIEPHIKFISDSILKELNNRIYSKK